MPTRAATTAQSRVWLVDCAGQARASISRTATGSSRAPAAGAVGAHPPQAAATQARASFMPGSFVG